MWYRYARFMTREELMGFAPQPAEEEANPLYTSINDQLVESRLNEGNLEDDMDGDSRPPSDLNSTDPITGKYLEFKGPSLQIARKPNTFINNWTKYE